MLLITWYSLITKTSTVTLTWICTMSSLKVRSHDTIFVESGSKGKNRTENRIVKENLDFNI